MIAFLQMIMSVHPSYHFLKIIKRQPFLRALLFRYDFSSTHSSQVPECSRSSVKVQGRFREDLGYVLGRLWEGLEMV